MDKTHNWIFQKWHFRLVVIKQALAFLLIAGSTALLAQQEDKTSTVEFRASYFRPSSSVLRSIYGNAGVDYQLTGTVALTSFFHETSYDVLKGLHLWGAVDYFAKNGHSLGEEPVKTDFYMVPVTAGLKYIHPSKTWRPYLGLGLRYFFTKTSNDSNFACRDIHKNALGGVVEAGLLFSLCENCHLDLFAAYSQGKLRAPSNTQPNVKAESLQVGGMNVGIGVSYAF